MAGRVRIVHLYAEELNLYGDSGNVLCLRKRLADRGFFPEIRAVGVGDRLDDFDILFIGGGQDREMGIIAGDIRKKSQALKYYIENGSVVLAICGGYQILGEYYKGIDGDVMRLADVLPFFTVGNRSRMIGNIVTDTPFGKMVGFENHAGRTYLSSELNPLGHVITGSGNNGEDGGEGVLYKNTFCTYAHGPVLPKNPALADEIIKRALQTNDLMPLDDTVEIQCHDHLVSRFG